MLLILGYFMGSVNELGATILTKCKGRFTLVLMSKIIKPKALDILQKLLKENK